MLHYIKGSHQLHRIKSTKMLSQGQNRSSLMWLILITSLATAAAAVDCDKPVNVSPQSFKNCCRMPNPNFNAFKDQCGKHLQHVSHMSPCLYECIFNSTNALTGTTLNMNNIRPLVTKFMGGNTEFIDVFVKGFENCSSSVEDFAKMRRPYRMPMSESCSMVPLYLGMCAWKYAFAHCPAASWSNIDSCNEGRDFMLNCKDKEHSSRGGRHPMRF